MCFHWRTLAALAAALVAGGTLGIVPSASAASDTYAITSGMTPTFSATLSAFQASQCSNDTGLLNGADARIVDVSARAGKQVDVKYVNADVKLGVASTLRLSFYRDSDCTTLGGSGSLLSVGETKRLTLPSGAKWMVAAGSFSAGIRFSITDV